MWKTQGAYVSIFSSYIIVFSFISSSVIILLVKNIFYPIFFSLTVNELLCNIITAHAAQSDWVYKKEQHFLSNQLLVGTWRSNQIKSVFPLNNFIVNKLWQAPSSAKQMYTYLRFLRNHMTLLPAPITTQFLRRKFGAPTYAWAGYPDSGQTTIHCITNIYHGESGWLYPW